MRDEECSAADNDDKDERGDNPCRLAPQSWRVFAVEPAVERIDERAHPRHRMTDCAREPIRITEHHLEQKCEESE